MRSKIDKKEYALKYSSGGAMRDEKHAYSIKNEAFLLNKISHPNIIKVVDFYETIYEEFISVMEYRKCYTLK